MHPPVLIALPVRKDAGLQLRDQRGVVRQYSQLPAKARRYDLIDLLAQDKPFRRDYFKIEFVCHRLVVGGWWLLACGWLFDLPPTTSHQPPSLHLLSRFDYFVNPSLEKEGLLGDVVVLAFDDLAEAADRLFDGDQLAFQAGELRRHEEGL